MIRNEVFNQQGVCLSAEIIDLDAGTISFEDRGVVKSTRALTSDEVARYAPVPRESSVEERLAILEAENAALRKALVKSDVVTDAAIEAEKVSAVTDEVAAVKR